MTLPDRLYAVQAGTLLTYERRVLRDKRGYYSAYVTVNAPAHLYDAQPIHIVEKLLREGAMLRSYAHAFCKAALQRFLLRKRPQRAAA